MRRAIVATSANQAWGDQNGLYLSRGTLTLETRPVNFTGVFTASSLEIALTQGDMRSLRGMGDLISPLPANEQPDQDDPVSSADALPTTSPDPSATPDPNSVPPAPPIKPGIGAQMPNGLPAIQLFDRVAQKWVEFDSFSPQKSYRITDPQKYVDAGGAVLYRFVNRADAGDFGEEQVYFQLLSRIEGTIQQATDGLRPWPEAERFARSSGQRPTAEER
jgi:hypothetical protein